MLFSDTELKISVRASDDSDSYDNFSTKIRSPILIFVLVNQLS